MSPAITSKLRSAAVTLTAILVGAAGLAACGGNNDAPENPAAGVVTDDDRFHGTLVDPPLHPANVVLKDTQGAPFDLTRPAPDKATALFFGFTNCDDICPTTMADLAAARRLLPPALAAKVTVVFVTVDPHRDTRPVLERWLDQFDPDFIGLHGPTELVNQAERSLYLPESGEESAPAADRRAGGHHESSSSGHHTGGHEASSKVESDYEVSHSGSVYVFGPGDKLLLYTGGTRAQEYAEDFTRLLTP